MNDAHPPQPDAPQLRTLLLTDLCDSMALVERLGDGNAAELFKQHDHLVLELQQRWRGRLIDRSDGLLLLFERPIDGLGFALDYSRGLNELAAPRKLQLKVRAGLHVGEVLTWRNSDEAVQVGAKPLEVEGLAKPMAARLMSLARPGQILLSAVAESLTHRAARELGERGERLLWKSHGRWRFKGVPTAQEIYEVGEIDNTPLRAPKPTPKAWRDLPLWRRPAALAAEVALIAAVAIGTWAATRPQPAIAFAERDWVVVGDLRNLTGNALLDDSLQQAFRVSVEQSRYVNVLSDMKVRQTLRLMRRDPEKTRIDRNVASEIAQRDGAKAVLLATVSEIGGHVRVSAELVDPHTQATVRSVSVDGKGIGSALESIDAVTEALRADLGESMQSIERDSDPLPSVTTSNLDALRAYALAQKAVATRDMAAAIRLYERAIALDDGFALAYMGLARIQWSSLNEQAAVPLLNKALQLREELPPRDRLYLDAWRAELLSAGSPLPQWQLLASMYPDHFAGASNASWYLIAENRFDEAMPFARAAAVPQDPLRAYPLDHIGRIQLARGEVGNAMESFLQAERAGGGEPIRYRADALAVMGKHDEARQLLLRMKAVPGIPSSMYSSLDLISVALDGGRADQALQEAVEARRKAEQYGEPHISHFRLVEQSVRLVAAPESVSLAELRDLATVCQRQMGEGGVRARQDAAYRFLATIYLLQRGGFKELSGEFIKQLPATADPSQEPVLAGMESLVKATQLRLQGEPARAIALLAPMADGRESVQVRSQLLAAYMDNGQTRQAQEQANWLKTNIGRSYVEVNMNQLFQPLNVADSRAAREGAVESLRQVAVSAGGAAR